MTRWKGRPGEWIKCGLCSRQRMAECEADNCSVLVFLSLAERDEKRKEVVQPKAS